MSTMFRPISYGPCSRTGVTCVGSDFPHIKFTIEPEKDSKLPFLDICTHILDDGSTHMDQYLNFKSHDPLTHKHSVVRTLTNKAQQYVTSAEDRKSELAHVHKALRANGYPEWALAPHPVQKDHLARTTTHKDLCWDYHIWQDYQNSLAGFISHTTYTCTTSKHPPLNLKTEHQKNTNVEPYITSRVTSTAATLTLVWHSARDSENIQPG